MIKFVYLSTGSSGLPVAVNIAQILYVRPYNSEKKAQIIFADSDATLSVNETYDEVMKQISIRTS